MAQSNAVSTSSESRHDYMNFKEWHNKRIKDLLKTELPNMPPWGYFGEPDSRSFTERYPNYKGAYASLPKESSMAFSNPVLDNPGLKSWGFKSAKGLLAAMEGFPEKFEWMQWRSEKTQEPLVITHEQEKELGPLQEPQLPNRRGIRLSRPDSNNKPDLELYKEFNIVEVRLTALASTVKQRKTGAQFCPFYDPRVKRRIIPKQEWAFPFECKKLIRTHDDNYNSLLCFNCYQYGHHFKDCRNPTLAGFRGKTGRRQGKKNHRSN